MLREIIRIHEDKCDGCGQCIVGCPEGALQIIEGKARLVSELTCDGLGACVGTCPQGAIVVEKREAEAYSERTTLDVLRTKGPATLAAHLRHLADHGQDAYLDEALAYLRELGLPIPDYARKEAAHHASAPVVQLRRKPSEGSGCPGTAAREFDRTPAAPSTARGAAPSQLTQWPVQLHLISPQNPMFRGANFLLAADCVAFALADFNQHWLPKRKLAIACPKLDSAQEAYVDKLQVLIDDAQIESLTVMIMEVPCCMGLLRTAQRAMQQARRKIPIECVVVGTMGEVKSVQRA